MKKLLSVFFSGALVLSLAACGGEKPFDSTAVFHDLMETPGVFTSGLEEVDQATACALYGIDETTVTGCLVYMANATSADELAIFTLSNEEAAQTASTQLGYRVEDQKEALADYLPDELSKLEGAIVVTRGNSVLLLVCSDYDAARTVLDAKKSSGGPGKAS